MHVRTVLAVLYLAVLASCGGGGSGGSEVSVSELPFAEAEKFSLAGDWSFEGNTKAFVVRSAEEWNQVWAARKASIPCPSAFPQNAYFCSAAAPPQIDFERYSLVGILLFSYFLYDEPNPRHVEDNGQTLIVSYRYYSSGHAQIYTTSTRFFLVPRTNSALQVNARQCSSSC